MASSIPDYLLWLVWTFIENAQCVRRPPNIQLPDLNSEDLPEEFMSDSQVIFAPGLTDILQGANPPSLTSFKNLPTDTGHRWGIYILVLEHEGFHPKIYVGSRTHALHGVRARWNQYDERMYFPQFVSKVLDDGYTITNKGLLCWSPVPIFTNRLGVRHLYLILETCFLSAFWAMESRTKDYRMPKLCLWPLQSLGYDGCCSHAAIFEGHREGGCSGAHS